MNLSKSGERIKEMRQRAGLTQDQLAAKLSGIGTARGKSTISEYEHGKNLTLSNLQRMADVLDCDVDYLLGCIEHPDITTSWIAEQIPISREAIESLKKLGHDLIAYSDYDSALLIGILNDLIIGITDSLREALEAILDDPTRISPPDSFMHTAVEMLSAYEAIADYESMDSQYTTTQAYYYAKIAITALRMKLGTFLSDIVANTIKEYADPKHQIKTEV